MNVNGEVCMRNTTWNLGSHLSICLRTEDKEENLHRDCRSPDLLDAYCLLASSSANKRRKSLSVSLKSAVTLLPI